MLIFFPFSCLITYRNTENKLTNPRQTLRRRERARPQRDGLAPPFTIHGKHDHQEVRPRRQPLHDEQRLAGRLVRLQGVPETGVVDLEDEVLRDTAVVALAALQPERVLRLVGDEAVLDRVRGPWKEDWTSRRGCEQGWSGDPVRCCQQC